MILKPMGYRLEGWSEERKCACCGKTFTAHHPKAKYCSDVCLKTVKAERQRERRKNPDYRKREIKKAVERYHNDPEFRYRTLQQKRKWRESEKGKAYNKAYFQQYYLDHAEDRRAYARMKNQKHECGFTGLCTDCPFEYCTEQKEEE